MHFTKQLTASVLGGIFLVGLFVLTTDASAQSIQRQVIGNGATMVYDGSGNLILGGTVGQAIVGVSGYEPGEVDIYHGFWFLSGITSVPTDPVAGHRSSLWNSPNPFTSTTTIHFEVPSRSQVRLRIYDMDGKLVRSLVDGPYGVGNHSVVWDAADDLGEQLATGYYYYTLDAQPSANGGQAVSYQQKMLLMK